MRIKSHGGECCGLRHLVNFPIYPHHGDIDEFFQLTKPYQPEGNQRKIALECILRNDQLRSGWAQPLREAGFRLTATWINPNSGARLYQFMLYNRGRPGSLHGFN